MSRWTSDTDARLKELRDAGYTVAQIAAKLGFGPSWIEVKVRELGLRKRAPNGQAKRRKAPKPPVERGPAADTSRPAVVPEGLQPVVCKGVPNYDVRYGLPTDTRVLGGFATLRPGQYPLDAASAAARAVGVRG